MQPITGDPDVTYTGQEFRRLLEGLMAAGGIAIDSEGCLGSGQLQVTQRGAGANFSVDISAGQAFILGNDITNQGTYHVWNDTTFNLVTPGAPGSGTRIHRVVAQIRDKAANGAYSTYDWQFQLLQDTGSGEPAEPASAITLAHVSIAAAQGSVTNANITDARPQLGQALESFTPVWGGGGALAFSTNEGWYFRIGKMIFVNFYGVASVAGTGGATVTVAGPTAIYRHGGTARQALLLTAKGWGGGSGVRTGFLLALAGGSGAVWDEIHTTLNTVVDMSKATGTDIPNTAIITIQGWYREA
jgi:hypothetical protein